MYLNEFEERVVNEVGQHCHGRAWVSRPRLVEVFCPAAARDSPQRKRLDRALKRLVTGEVLVRQISKDGGVAYALAETAVEMPWLRQQIRNAEMRGKAAVICPVGPKWVTEEQMEIDIKRLENGPRRLKLYELRAIRQWRAGKRQGVFIIHQNDGPISIVAVNL